MTPDPLTPSPDSVFLNPEIARRIEELDKEYQAADPAVRHGLAVIHYEEVLKIAVQQGLSFVADIHSAIKCGEALGLADDDPRTLIEAAHDLRAENAALVKEWEADHRQIEWLQNFADSAMATLAEENRSLRAQLAETQLKLERMEKESRDVPLCAHHAEVWFCDRRFEPGDCWFCDKDKELEAAETDAREANRRWEGVVELNITFTNQLLALQAHVEKLTDELVRCEAALSREDLREEMKSLLGSIDATLASQPDLPLIEEVREVLGMAYNRALDWDMLGRAHGNTEVQIWRAAAIKLLTRLNPRKD